MRKAGLVYLFQCLTVSLISPIAIVLLGLTFEIIFEKNFETYIVMKKEITPEISITAVIIYNSFKDRLKI